ncbi:MAG: N-acetylmuramoyl-L-alanine amidase [bacterium]|nr:N-acetylmuramoyl-L-alanine amidase [bacterium]
MRKIFFISFFLLVCGSPAEEPLIIDKPIKFNSLRKKLTRKYALLHYGSKNITIKPEIIVIHRTGAPGVKQSFNVLNPVKIKGRPYLKKFGEVNVSAHFLVGRNGTIYRLMPSTLMGRHVIGLNHCSIGIENAGSGPLTNAQLSANAELVRFLVKKHPGISCLIGHYEYQQFEKSSLFIEKVKGYRTVKTDPGKEFMRKLRFKVRDLGLKGGWDK